MLSEFNTFCGQYENIIKAFGALAPFFGTVFLAYIAYQQWQTNERQRRKELFEMRYEHLYKFIIDTINNLFKISIKYHDDKNKESLLIEQRDEIFNIFLKYVYLIKKQDSEKLYGIFHSALKDIFKLKITDRDAIFKKYTELNIYYHSKIDKLLEPYLRIEPNYTIWDILKNFIISTYEFLAPRWLQNFLSKTKTVILNSIQNLTEKKQKPTGEAE